MPGILLLSNQIVKGFLQVFSGARAGTPHPLGVSAALWDGFLQQVDHLLTIAAGILSDLTDPRFSLAPVRSQTNASRYNPTAIR